MKKNKKEKLINIFALRRYLYELEKRRMSCDPSYKKDFFQEK
jgi:hypothetical protein